jgi:serine/threonine protein kinase
MERELARGGMGSLWVASDLRLKRRVAVKLIASRAVHSAEMVARFEREACAAAALKSAHVVQIHDYGFDGGVAYMVMELLDGEDLRTRLERMPWLPLGEVGPIVAQTAKALEHIHGAGMLHRDLKPANIFLAMVSGQEVVKVIDFGVVRTNDTRRWTRDHEILGTPRYMSPEQIRGSAGLDVRCDLWSLGVIAYRALTGRHPFSGSSLGELEANIHRGAFMPATQLAPELPASVDAFFARALAVAKHERFATAEELASAFAKVCRSSFEATLPLGSKRVSLASAPELPAVALLAAGTALASDDTVPFPLSQRAAAATVKKAKPERGAVRSLSPRNARLDAGEAGGDPSPASHDAAPQSMSTMSPTWSQASTSILVQRRRWHMWLPLTGAGVALVVCGAALTSFVRGGPWTGSIAAPVSAAPAEPRDVEVRAPLSSSASPAASSDAPAGSASAGGGRGAAPTTRKARHEGPRQR